MDLTLTEAWTLWWSGQQLTDHTLYGASVLWLARTGKLLAFLAGTTIVLDIIGSERIIAWGERIQKDRSRTYRVQRWMYRMFIGVAAFAVGFWVLGLALGWLGAPAWVLMVFLIVAPGLLPDAMLGAAGRIVVAFGQLLTRPRFERWLRIIAVPLFFAGFALDYLAS